jgi:DNA-binding CsgD family transcriptional regulator
VRVANLQLREISLAAVAKAFKLPPRQSRLVVALVNGESLKEFAKAARISERTSKHHVTLLRKQFECRTQVELVRKLCILMM